MGKGKNQKLNFKDQKLHPKLHPKLEALKPVVKGIAATFGKNCEVVLHDLSRPESSLVMIEGSVTGRKPGAPITDLVLKHLRVSGDDTRDIIGYSTRTKDGKLLKASTIFIRDVSGKIIGCLCINYDLTDFITARQIIDNFCACSSNGSGSEGKNGYMETFAEDINEVVDAIVDDVINNMGVPVKFMQKDDKMRVVEVLDDRGVFLVKGVVDQVAMRLGVSRYTIYNYLEEIRALKNATV